MVKPLVHSEVLARLQALGLKPEHQAYVLKRLKLAVPDAPAPDAPEDGSAVDGSAVDGFALATAGEPRPAQARAAQLPTVQIVVEQAPRAASSSGPAQPPLKFPSESAPQPPLPAEPAAAAPLPAPVHEPAGVGTDFPAAQPQPGATPAPEEATTTAAGASRAQAPLAEPPDDGPPQPLAAAGARLLQQASVAQALAAQMLQTIQQAALLNARRQLQQARLEAQTHPLREWSSGARVMAAIAVATGGIGTALADSGRNAALDTIENGIEDEIARRVLTLAPDGAVPLHTPRALAGGAGNTEERDTLHPRAAELALRAAYLEQVRQQVLATAERAPAALHRANGQALAADLEQAAQQARDALVQAGLGQGLNSAGPHPGALVPRQQGRPSPTFTERVDTLTDARQPRFNPGAAATGLRQSLDELIRLGSQGRAAPGSPRAKSIGQLTRTVLEQYRTLRKQGVFDGLDAELEKTRVTEPVRFAALNLKGDVAAARRLRTVLDRTLGETGQGFHP